MSHFATPGSPPSAAEAELANAFDEEHGAAQPTGFWIFGLMRIRIDCLPITAAFAAIFAFAPNVE